MHGQGHLVSLDADADSGRCFLLVGPHRAAEIFVDFLNLEGEITGPPRLGRSVGLVCERPGVSS